MVSSEGSIWENGRGLLHYSHIRRMMNPDQEAPAEDALRVTMMQTYPARFLVSRDALTGNDILMQVTTGPHGEILALAVDRDWGRPTLSEPSYRYTIRSWQQGIHYVPFNSPT